jgi:hypothetical protein
MALTCTVATTPTTYQAGSTPPPSFTISCSNATAAAIVVTGVELVFTDGSDVVIKPPVATPIVPLGPGMIVSVPASSSITLGPFSLAVASAANARIEQMVPPNTAPLNMQGSQPTTYTLKVGATVYASDGSVNAATADTITIQYLGYA